jgi:predicted GNAT family N-acyltransferase
VKSKIGKSGYVIEPMGASHDRAAFCCGTPELDDYIRQQAGQDQKRGLAAVFVLTIDGQTVAGFYTLSAHSINASELPADLAKRMPRFPIPVTLLGRMAVAKSSQGQGLGEFMLVDALDRTLRASRQVASIAVVVDAKAGARDFYLKHGFTPFPAKPGRLFLPMKTIETMFE